eukprot:m.80294 g.80294  ORF g.80294 m.80294 type:complete len:51 (-) comp8620_c0_seq15:1195-1347(-)
MKSSQVVAVEVICNRSHVYANAVFSLNHRKCLNLHHFLLNDIYERRCAAQ